MWREWGHTCSSVPFLVSAGDGHPPAAAGGQQGGSFQLPAFLQQGGSGQAAPPAGRPAAQSGSSRAQPGKRPNFGQLRGEGQQDGMGMVWGQRASSTLPMLRDFDWNSVEIEIENVLVSCHTPFVVG